MNCLMRYSSCRYVNQCSLHFTAITFFAGTGNVSLQNCTTDPTVRFKFLGSSQKQDVQRDIRTLIFFTSEKNFANCFIEQTLIFQLQRSKSIVLSI